MSKNIDLSQRIERIKPSPTLSISARADELKAVGKNIINLSVGESDFNTPEHINAAAIKAIHDGQTRYTAVDGVKSLKQAIIDKFGKENNLNYTLNQVIASCGAKHSLYNLFNVILNAGDEVIIAAPYWVSYPDIVLLNDGKPVIIDTDMQSSFKITPEKLQQAITERTRAIIFNSPSNPTGMVYTRDELQKLGEVLLQHPNILVVSDDIYEHNIWNHKPFTNILNACPELYDRSIIVNGVAKAYAMTGWRIGYAAGPAKIIAAMKKAQSQSTSNPTTISQYATIAALTGNQECVTIMTDAYKKRHDYIFAELKKMPGIDCLPADGTFYIYPCIKNLLNNAIATDMDFAEYLLNEAEIAVVPGTAFGTPGYLRISYATSMQNITTAMERIREVIKKLS